MRRLISLLMVLVLTVCVTACGTKGETETEKKSVEASIFEEDYTSDEEVLSERVTIPDGYTVDQILDMFEGSSVFSRDEFVRVINEADLDDYWFVRELPENTDRYYRLEGYLLPGTYIVNSAMSEEEVIRTILDGFDKKFTDAYREALSKTINPLTEAPYTVDEIITLASIIQAEGSGDAINLMEDESLKTYVDYGLVSGVFNNRMSLGSPMKLQSDATVMYAMTKEGKADAELSDYTNSVYENSYNTYYVDGLPAGAICNPGITAIHYAIKPEKSSYYYFYFTRNIDGDMIFAQTLDEHMSNINSLKDDPDSLKREELAPIKAKIKVKDYGIIWLELYPDKAPITVANFCSLATSGFYRGLTFHRIMEGFMIQGGDPNGNGTGGSLPIKGEFYDNGVENDISHERGVISMARRGDSYDSGSCQFFIVHQDSPHLDGQYAAFGRVTEGMEIVDAICADAAPVDNNGTITASEQPIIETVSIWNNVE